jgi:hypothetical protein
MVSAIWGCRIVMQNGFNLIQSNAYGERVVRATGSHDMTLEWQKMAQKCDNEQ